MGLLTKGVVASVLVAFLMGYNPFWIWSGTKALLGTGISYLTNSQACTDAQQTACTDAHSLKAAMRNVTTDYDQLASIVQEFFRQPQSLDMLNASAITEAQFRAFLMHKASRSFPALENSLDWVLCIYKIAFPFMIFLIILKISSSGSTTDQAAKGQSTDSQHLQQTFVSPPSSPAASTISGRTFSTISDNSEQMMVRSRSALHRPRF